MHDLRTSPREPDGKPVIVPAPFTEGLYMFVSCRGDDLIGGEVKRGEGTKMYLEFTGPDTDSVIATFHEMVEMHDGHVDFDPTEWDWADEWSVFVNIPATPCTANGGGTGNANKVDLGGGANLIVPAAGDGDWDVDIGSPPTVVAVPDEGNGYWDYDPWTDTMTPSASPGSADWQLFDFPMGRVYLVKAMMCSSRLGYWELDAYKVEPIYPRWQFGLEVVRSSSGAAKIGGHFTCFRKDTT